ncbi:MAG: PQQ-binding-like beta-propeller repeat protein [Tepidisphaerales bacterium]
MATIFSLSVAAADWPQWCGTDGKNMVSLEKNLPASFEPGERRTDGTMDPASAKNVRWGVKFCNAAYSTPSIVGGKVFVGGRDPDNGVFACLDAATGKLLWKWQAPARKVPKTIDGFSIGISEIPVKMGVCSSATVDGDRVYFVSNRFEVICLDANGEPPGPQAGQARVIWSLDMFDKLGVFPCDAANGSPLIDGDLLYVQTSNGIDRNTFANPLKEKDRKFPAPNAPNLIVLDKKTGRLVATDDTRIVDHLLHGQWSSPSLGKVGDQKLVFFAGGDSRLYAFAALPSVPAEPVKLKTVWSYDCIPPEYKVTGDLDWISHYSLGDKRVKGTINKSDGTFVGMSEIIGTPVFVNNRVYVAIGRDPEHGRGRGALHCIDARGTGDITQSGKVWTYQGIERTLSTVSVADGLVYVSDVGGTLHCVDADTGKPCWTHPTHCEIWGSTLVADGKVYMPTSRGLWILAAGRELKVLERISIGSVLSSPVVANGTMYITNTTGWLYAIGF